MKSKKMWEILATALVLAKSIAWLSFCLFVWVASMVGTVVSVNVICNMYGLI
jgi:hypothetical protein